MIKPSVSVQKLALVFFCPGKWDKVLLNKVSHPVTTGEDGATFSVSAFDFNARSDEIAFVRGKKTYNFKDELSVYLFDPEQISSHPYMTRNFLSSGARGIQGEDMLYKAIINLVDADPQWEFWGGMVTNACFRISERFADTTAAIDFLYERYMALGPSTKLKPNNSIRWFISASLNLAILLLYKERIEDAKRVISVFASKVIINNSFPLTYLNVANMAFLRSALALHDGDREDAYLFALEAAEACHVATAKLFTSRNRYYFAHRYDVEAFVRMGYAASAVANALAPRRPPTDTIVEYQRRRYDGPINYDLVSWRYTPLFKKLPPFIYGVNSKANAIARELDAK